jgi:hypothetical protein
MTSWGTVLLELLALLPTLLGWLRERSTDKKQALQEALNEREKAWADGDATRILNSVRRG